MSVSKEYITQYTSLLLTCLGGVNSLDHKSSYVQFLKKLNIELPYNPAILLLGIYTKELTSVLKRYLHIHVHSSIIHKSQDIETN